MIETVLSVVMNTSVFVFAAVIAVFLGILARFAGAKKAVEIATDSRFLIAVALVVWFLGTNELREERDRLKDEQEVQEIETGAIIDSADVVRDRERRRDEDDARDQQIEDAVDAAPQQEKMDVLLDEFARDQRRRRDGDGS